MHAVIELSSLVFQFVVLALVLGGVGFAVNKFISHTRQSRFESKVNSAAALARARANARQAHA